MIYLDNAATTWPKPLPVREAVCRALTCYGANPGRGGHRMAMETAEQIYACRETAADFFGLSDPARVVFTSNCTTALNFVIKGILSHGGHAVVSDMEHNAVMRPLEALFSKGVTYSTAKVYEDDAVQTVENFRQCIRPDTRLILCMHASNVFGTVLPIREIGALAHRHGLLFAVDGAQSAGILPIDMEHDNIDFLCVPGHKGLYGPMGTGMLLCRSDTLLQTVLEGGTGNRSLELMQPEELPERLESGTLNVAGICGLRAGMQWVKAKGITAISQKETAQMQCLYDILRRMPNVTLYSPIPSVEKTVPLISFTVAKRPSEQTATLLASEGVAVRAGLHCAPCAHAHAYTLPNGTVRIAPSAFTTWQEMERLQKILIKITRKP